MTNRFINLFHFKYDFCELKMQMACRQEVHFTVWKNIFIGDHNGDEFLTSPLVLSETSFAGGRWEEGRDLCVKSRCWWRQPAFLLQMHIHSDTLGCGQLLCWEIAAVATVPSHPSPICSLHANDLGSGCQLQCLTICSRRLQEGPTLDARLGDRCHPLGEGRKQGRKAEEYLFSHLPRSQGLKYRGL